MVVENAEHPWTAVRDSLRQTTERFAELVSAVPDCDVKATAKWSVTDVAAHVTGIAWLDTTLLQPGADPFPMPGLTDAIAGTGVDDVHGLNDVMLGHFTERDPQRILAMLRSHVTGILDACADRDPADTVPWLAGSQLPLAGLVAHLLNELLIHGDDIARAVNLPWSIPAQDAAYFFELFFIGLLSGQMGRIFEGGKRPSARRIAVEFRSGYTTPVTVVARGGQVSVEPPGSGADVTVRFDPATLNLMLFGRVSRPRAVLSRKVAIGGRRPWLMQAFSRTVRTPA